MARLLLKTTLKKVTTFLPMVYRITRMVLCSFSYIPDEQVDVTFQDAGCCVAAEDYTLDGTQQGGTTGDKPWPSSGWSEPRDGRRALVQSF